MKLLLRYLELIFTAAGLLVIFGITALVHLAGTSPWTVAAITATCVGVIHGALFWVIRQRQRQVRRAALADAQGMLRDIVLNHLTVIRLNIDLQDQRAASQTRSTVDRMEEAVNAINAAILDVSEESLARWHARYNPSTYRS